MFVIVVVGITSNKREKFRKGKALPFLFKVSYSSDSDFDQFNEIQYNRENLFTI